MQCLARKNATPQERRKECPIFFSGTLLFAKMLCSKQYCATVRALDGNVRAVCSTVSGPYCKVTGRRHRVSPCRSAYFASPWRLLTLNLRKRRTEAVLLFPES